MKLPELLAPAGNFEKMQTAIHYGADAVYLGGKKFSLRAHATNFSDEEIAQAVTYAHERGVQVYTTLNIFAHNDDLAGLPDYLAGLREAQVDGLIISDPGILAVARRVAPELPIHLSTQANVTNLESVRFWAGQGVKRLNLARELSLAEITQIRQATGAELEIFVHGALCISYSGRCLLSSVMAGRDANQGECAHPCRWNYRLVEEKRPGEYFPVMEDANGTFIFNSRDLCLLEHLPAIIAAGAASLKIEGRMKGINYVASVLRVYRQALDAYLADPAGWRCRPEWLEELSKLSHRGYTTGFLFGEPRNVGQEYRSAYIRSHEFVGLVEEVREDGTAVVGVRNRIQSGDALEVIGPGMRTHGLLVDHLAIVDGDGSITRAGAANPNQRIVLILPFRVEPFDLIRREKGAAP